MGREKRRHHKKHGQEAVFHKNHRDREKRSDRGKRKARKLTRARSFPGMTPQQRTELFKSLKASFLRQRDRCEFIEPEETPDGNFILPVNGMQCGSIDTTLHHCGGRDGENLFLHWMPCCQRHQSWIHDKGNERAARQVGYLLPAFRSPHKD